jgi:uncharacterized repeat protein (TIGR01451 family)
MERAVASLRPAPDYVLVASEAAVFPLQRSSAMPGDATASFRNEILLPDRIQALEANGFQVGRDLAANQTGVVHHYVAWKQLNDWMEVGSYAGNGADQRIRAQHPSRLVIGEGNASRSHSAPGILGAGFVSPVRWHRISGSAIQALLADGFQVGTRAEVNAAGTSYYWAAFAGPGAVADIALTHAVDLGTANEGNAVAFTIGIENLGPDDANGIEVTDLLPPGLSYIAHTSTQGSYDPASGVWRWGLQTAGRGRHPGLHRVRNRGRDAASPR